MKGSLPVMFSRLTMIVKQQLTIVFQEVEERVRSERAAAKAAKEVERLEAQRQRELEAEEARRAKEAEAERRSKGLNHLLP